MTDTFDFSILLRRKGRILLTAVFTAMLALAVNKMLPRVYTSDGGMIVENSEPNVPELGMGLGSQGGGTNAGMVLTQLEVLRSRGLIDRVVQKLNLASSPDLIPKLRLPSPLADVAGSMASWQKYLRSLVSSPDPVIEGDDSPSNTAIEYVQKHLKVAATDNSSVIAMSFSAGHPKLASDVLNGVMGEYLYNDAHRRSDQISQVNQWMIDRTNQLEQEADAAARKVENFVRDHNLPEIQGSSAAAIQLSQDQTHLALAKEDLYHQQAILDSISHGGGASDTTATLESRNIQLLKEHEAVMLEKIALLSSYDPRRLQLEQGLGEIRGKIAGETGKIVSSIKHNVDVARANVLALEAAVLLDKKETSQVGSAATELTYLKADADAKRQMYIAFGSKTEQMRMASSQLPSARILFPAALEPSHPFELMAMLLGFMVGLLGASATLVLRESLSRKITSTGKMMALTGLPVYGSLPEVEKSSRSDLLMLDSPTKSTSMYAETLRGIWLVLRGGSGGATVIVTSSEVGEGKTTVATTLARRIAADGYRVLLIDADLRRPKLARFLHMTPTNSLEGLLNGSTTLQQAVTTDTAYGVDCLLANGHITNPMRALASDEFRELLIDARKIYDFVLIDSPPVMRVADSVIIAKQCEHILFVVGAGRVTADSVTKAVNRFAEEDRGKILTLLTRVQSRDLDKDDYFGGYETMTLQ